VDSKRRNHPELMQPNKFLTHAGACLGFAFLTLPLHGQTLFEESFDSVTLGPNVDETVESDAAWSATPPEGWTVDNSKMPMIDGELIGTTEWRGWTFADPAWWASVDDQRRSDFTNASNVAAITDPDEWDDVGGPAGVGTFESYLISPGIDVSGLAGTSISVSFDFSWRPEGDQTGTVSVAFDGGASNEIFRLDTATTNDDMTNESKSIPLVVPAEASTMVVTFGMLDAGNNWFWAIDNVAVAVTTLYHEDFNSVTLGPNVDETVESDAAWTATPPEGWRVDNSNMPMVDGELIGTTEWRGWTFADPAWWASVDDQRRSEFTNANGAAAVADPDEWDDVEGPAGVGNFESYLISPDIDIASAAGGSASLAFDFSWRPEGNQTGNVTVVFDGGDSSEIFRLDTATSTDDMTNESRTVAFSVPEGAQMMKLSFGMFDAGNNWFWAIDNVSILPSSDPVLPSGLTGTSNVLAKTVTLSWESASNIAGTLEVLRDDVIIAELPIDATEYVDSEPPGNDADGRIAYVYGLRVKADGIDAEAISQEIVYSTGASMRTLFEESFDSVVLGEAVDEPGLGEGMDWTAEPPAGWTVDNSKMPMEDDEVLGTTEWRGWTFADPIFWAQVDDQRRSEFVNARGAVAIADPDEWDDVGGPAGVGTFESYLISPPINVVAEAGGNVSLVFDSSWRPEGNQKGNVTVSYDGGEAQEVLLLSTATTQDNETNEKKVLSLAIPAGAQEMVLTFGMFDAGNNWFWAIDNVLVTTLAVPICPTALASKVDLEAETVTLSWIAGANLEDAVIEVWRDGNRIVGDLPGDAGSYVDNITGVDVSESVLFSYELRVVGGPVECVPLTRTVVFSQGAISKLAQWDFEEGSGVFAANSEGDGLVGDLVDLTADSWVDANFLGGALTFAGDGYVDLGTSEEDDADRAKSDALRPQAGLTIAAWVNPDEFTEWAGIAGTLFDSGANEGGFYLNTRTPSDYSFALATESDGQLTYLRTEGVPGEWAYVVGTYDGEEQRLYLNGALADSRPASGPIDYDPAPFGFQIGTFIDDNEDVRFAGQITQVAMWNGALSEDQINLLFEIGRAGQNIDPALDSDGDGLLDEWEIANFGDLTAFSALDDPDNDQLINLSENREGTDPNKGDTDDDGVSDSTEIAFGSDANDGNAKPEATAVALLKSNNGVQSWDSPEVWSDGAAPSGAKTYFANGSFAPNLRTPSGGNGNFGGASLELFSGSQLFVQGSGAKISDLVLKDARLVQGGTVGSTVRLEGEISVVEPSFVFFDQDNSTFEIASTISGDQQLSLSQTSPFRQKGLEGGEVALSGNNEGFTGGWEVQGMIVRSGNNNAFGQSDITLIDATLDPDTNLNMPNQKLALIGQDVRIVLDNDMAFAEVSAGEFAFPEGTYTADDLLGLGFTEDNVFDGGGVLVVGGEVEPGPIPGTDPEPSGDFRVTSIASDGDQIQISWTSDAESSYAVETSADGEAWQNAETGIAGAGGETSAMVNRAGKLQLIRIRKE